MWRGWSGNQIFFRIGLKLWTILESFLSVSIARFLFYIKFSVFLHPHLPPCVSSRHLSPFHIFLFQLSSVHLLNSFPSFSSSSIYYLFPIYWYRYLFMSILLFLVLSLRFLFYFASSFSPSIYSLFFLLPFYFLPVSPLPTISSLSISSLYISSQLCLFPFHNSPLSPLLLPSVSTSVSSLTLFTF